MAASGPVIEPISKGQNANEGRHGNAGGEEIQKGERLIITRMVLENFKSWGGTKEIGPFHKNFSAVVGANGSGKLNIIHAMLFVFGKRAKQLRHNKVSELIHVSDQYPNLDQAKVSVYFQTIREKGGEDYEAVPGSELVITRTATKSNQSKYYFNDKTSSWGEITDLLKKRGIDLDNNRFLILQGEVEQIVMKPKAATPHDTGLLEYLEDIIGTNVYVEKIDAAAKVVDERNEERAEKLNRVRVVERERDGLEGARAEAEEFLTLERKIASSRAALLQHDRTAATLAAASRQQTVSTLQAKLAADQQRSQAAHDALATLETRYGGLKSAHDALAKELTRAKEDFAVFERKDVKFHEDLKHLKKKEKKLGEQLVADQKKLDESVKALADHRDEAVQLEAQEKEASAAAAAAEKKLDELQAALRGATAELHVQLEARQKELMPHAKLITERENAVRAINAELQLVQDRAAAAQSALNEARQRLAELAPKLKQQKEDAAACLSQLQACRKELAAAQKAAAEATAADESAHSQARTMRQRAEAARSAVAATRAKSAVLEALLEAKRQKHLEGIHGRLGDLASIDPKYDVAVSTACGSLENILVQTAEQAQRCVAFLRKRQLGTATFLILDKQAHLAQELQKPFQAPEGAQRLFDLIKAKKDEYLPALYYALRDTLVAPDLEAATRLAFAGSRRHRVVTLDGKLIDASGTMSGGGNRVSRGLMLLSSVSKQVSHAAGGAEEELSDADLKALEAEAAKTEEKQRAARTAATDATARVQELMGKVSALELQHQKLELALPALAATRTDLDARMPQLEAAAKPTAAEQQRVKDLQASLATAEASLAEARAAAAGVQKKIADVQAQIDNAGGGKLKQQKEKVASLQAIADGVAKSLTKAGVQAKTAEKNITKAKAALDSHKTEMDEVIAEHARVRDEYDKLNKDAQAVLQKSEQTQALLTGKTEELKATQAEYERAKATVTEIKKAELDIGLQLEDAGRFIKEQQAAEATASRKLAELQRHLKRLLADDDEPAADKEKDAPAAGAEADKDLLPVLTEAELAALDLESVREEIALHEQKKNQMKPNMGAIREYRRKQAEHAARSKELEAVTEARDAARRAHDELRKQRLQEFMAGFSVITLKLKEMYQMITLGGDAELELVDSLDPFSEGIVFSVRPPRKNWKNIQNLSGGEKTLSSLALVFALHHYKPTPLYVMDEIDAALDFKNVSIVANYIKERTKNAQFVIISLRNNMFEISDRMVGVYKTQHVSKSVTINPNSFQIPVK